MVVFAIMHGRLKVKTTKEQEEEKRKKREKKLALYLEGTNKAFEKRKNKEYDNEALATTQQLLTANPDFYSLWNFRKEILLNMSENLIEDEKQKLFTEELAVTESCLHVNPKSYGAWYQRCWILNNIPNPDWQHELKLCNRYLELDERNFHCWDYRKFIVEKAEVSPEEELQFTMVKINNNFSNYSSWHYRSKLLPFVYPNPDGKLLLREDIYLEELGLVQNAAFTDPDDQSAWFYHRWLLGRNEVPLAVRSIYVSRKNSCCIISLTKEIALSSGKTKFQLRINNSAIDDIIWKPSSPKIPTTSTWFAELSSSLLKSEKNLEIEVVLNDDEKKSSVEVNLESTATEAWNKREFTSAFKMELSAATSKVLEQELESCIQLQELEPDNKWMLLTSVFIMRALDSERFKTEVRTSLAKLKEIDFYRKHYYEDLYSRFILEDEISELNINQREVKIIDRGLTSLHHMDFLMQITSLDLSHNQLKSLQVLHPLQCLCKLTIDNNCISSCSGIEVLKQLEWLSIQNNKIETQAVLEPVAKALCLRIIYLTGNPISTNVEAIQWIKDNSCLEINVIF